MNPDLLAKLACPRCRGPLAVVHEAGGEPRGFGCGACKLLYAIEDGIPNFLIPEASAWNAPGAEATR